MTHDPSSPTASVTPTVPAGRRSVLDVVRGVLLVIVVVAVTVALVRNWSDVSSHLGAVSGRAWVLAVAGAMAAPLLTLMGWRALLADLGSPLSVPSAAGVFMVGQLGKYLPGSVWSVVVQTEMAKRLGVPRRRTGVVGLIAMVMALLTAAAVGLPALPLLLDRGNGTSLVLVGVALIVLVVAMWPPLLNRAVELALRLLRREPLERPLSARGISAMGAWFVGAWIATALPVWVFAGDLATPGRSAGELAIVTMSGFCLAAAVGMVSFLVPAGLGVREALLALLLVAVMPVAAATAVVVLSRFLTVLADVGWAALGWLWARAHHLWPGRAPSKRPGGSP